MFESLDPGSSFWYAGTVQNSYVKLVYQDHPVKVLIRNPAAWL